MQVRARRPGEPRRAGRNQRFPISPYTHPVHRLVRAHRPHLPGPASARRPDPAVRPRGRRRKSSAPIGAPRAGISTLPKSGQTSTMPRSTVWSASSPASSADAVGSGRRGWHPLNEVQSRRPAGVADDSHDEVHLAHPVTGPGCSERWNGVQHPASRGAEVAPEPSEEPSNEPSGAMGGVDHPAGGPTESGGGAAEFFTALSKKWRLTASQRARLSPAIAAAVSSGWEPQDLASWTCANTAGIRNPYAVLAARLSPAERHRQLCSERPVCHGAGNVTNEPG